MYVLFNSKVSFIFVYLSISRYAVIMAFDVKVEREAQEMAECLGVNVFVADIIYHLFDRFMKFREEWLLQKREEFKHLAIFPCKLRIYPEHIFNSRDPIVIGVCIEAGFLREGTMICVPSKEVCCITQYVSQEKLITCNFYSSSLTSVVKFSRNGPECHSSTSSWRSATSSQPVLAEFTHWDQLNINTGVSSSTTCF